MRLLVTVTLSASALIRTRSGWSGCTALCLVAFSTSSCMQQGTTERDIASSGMSVSTSSPSGKRTLSRSAY